MLGRASVAGLGAAVLMGAGAVGVAAAQDAERAGAAYEPVDLRKNDDEPGLVLVDDDEGDGDGDQDQDQTGTGTGTGDGDATTGDDGTSGGDNTATRTAARGPGGVRVSAGQLLINQRISQAAIRRLAVVEALRADRPPPRFDTTDDGGRRVRVSAGQLRINQRIAQAAVRRANALAGRPTPPRGGGSDRITLSARQLLINQRISQAAVRRANALLRAERGG